MFKAQVQNTAQHNTKMKILLLCFSALVLSACDSKKEKTEPDTTQAKLQEKAEVLPYLNMQEAKAVYALPFCEKKNCIEVNIQTIKTQDPWLNQWIANNQSTVIQNQIGSKQNMTLQQAINAYVKKSDVWQQEFNKNKAYELHMTTRIASQRNQFVLLQVSVDTKQEDISVKERQYFFVADRKLKKNLSVLDVIQANKQNKMNELVQEKYQEWLNQQDKVVKKAAPKKLYWGQADWFFDGEGIGLHYRASEIVADGKQLDIYFSKEHTQNILKPEVFHKMF